MQEAILTVTALEDSTKFKPQLAAVMGISA
jgi:hypothetical protein